MKKFVISKVFINRLKSHTVLIDLIKKPNKTHEELCFILEKIRKIKFFREFLESTFKGGESETLLKFCNSITYEIIPRNQIIIRQNEVSNNKMYVILTGSAFVAKLDVSFEVASERQQTPTSGSPSALNKIRRNATKPVETNQTCEDSINKFGKIIREMKSGEGFGEQALLWNVKRTATVITKTDCDLLIIEKKDFVMVLDQYKEALFKKQDILNEVFPSIKKNITSSKIIESILFSFKTMNFIKGQTLTKEKDESSCGRIFVVEKGEFIVEKTCRETDIKKIMKDDFYKFKKNVVNFQENLKVCLVGPNTIIGEECLFSPKDQYSYTVTCISQEGSALSITKNDFKKQCPKFLHEYLFEIFQDKTANRNELIDEQIINFFEKFNDNLLLKKKNHSHQLNNKKTSASDSNINNKDNVADIKKITKKYFLTKTNLFVKINQDLINKKMQTSMNFSQLKEEKNPVFQNLFEHEISKFEKKYLHSNLPSLQKFKPKESTATGLKKNKTWFVDHFMRKTKNNIEFLRKFPQKTDNSSSSFNSFLVNDEDYGISIRSLMKNESSTHCLSQRQLESTEFSNKNIKTPRPYLDVYQNKYDEKNKKII